MTQRSVEWLLAVPHRKRRTDPKYTSWILLVSDTTAPCARLSLEAQRSPCNSVIPDPVALGILPCAPARQRGGCASAKPFAGKGLPARGSPGTSLLDNEGRPLIQERRIAGPDNVQIGNLRRGAHTRLDSIEESLVVTFERLIHLDEGLHHLFD